MNEDSRPARYRNPTLPEMATYALLIAVTLTWVFANEAIRVRLSEFHMLYAGSESTTAQLFNICAWLLAVTAIAFVGSFINDLWIRDNSRLTKILATPFIVATIAYTGFLVLCTPTT